MTFPANFPRAAVLLYNSAGDPITIINDVTTPANKRLLVEADIKPGSSVKVSRFPSDPAAFVSTFLKNNSSKEMNVDGSTTPVDFIFNADPVYDIALDKIKFIFHCDSLPTGGDDFGSDGILDNGVKFDIILNSVTTELVVLNTNDDFLLFPQQGTQLPSYDGPIGDVLVASFDFDGAVVMSAGSSDQLKIIVRDDIRSNSKHKCNLFRAAVYGIKDLS